jgi:hypothetical protein
MIQSADDERGIGDYDYAEHGCFEPVPSDVSDSFTSGWICSRPRGHLGRHAAYHGGRMPRADLPGRAVYWGFVASVVPLSELLADLRAVEEATR